MATKWTKEQLSAIESKGQNLLLSAAAGSGKTAVLVERIISRITDRENPVDADRLLVVTFTNAAANEMRERIISGLEKIHLKDPENSNIVRQLTLVKRAQITTIDSFCIDVLRKFFVEAELPPDFSIADPTECKVLLDEVLDDVINEMYDDATYGTDFLCLMESYASSKANDRAFRELLTSIYYFSTSLPYPDEWLDNSADKFLIKGSFSDSVYKDIIIKEAHEECQRAVSEYSQMIELSEEDMLFNYVSLFKEEMQIFKECIEIFDYDELKNKLDNIEFKRIPTVAKDLTPVHIDRIKDMRKKIKERRVGKLCEKLLNLTSSQQEKAINKMYPLMKCLSETIKRLSLRFLEQKLSKNMLDFSDCEHFCLNVLKKQEVAQLIRYKYDEIYIDEYQDTSKLQEAIFASIKKENNLFMVGDIKQSIYRFRNTDPILFKTKRDEFSKDADSLNRKIILSKNFRSRKNILASVNYIFERIMSEDSGEIDYNEDEKLYLGADYPEDSPNPLDYETEVAIIDTKAISEDEEDLGKIELQAMYCAKRIAELIDSGAQVSEGGKYRKITYKDICIISRNVKDNAVILNAVFSDYGIPCYAENTGSYFESREVEVMLSMLSVIDNPYQDLPLLTVLRSVIYNISSEELAKIRTYNKKGSYYDAIIDCSKEETDEGKLCRGIIASLESFSEKSKRMSVSELILDIYNTTGYYDAQQVLTNGIIRCANLRLLYNRAKSYENTGLRGLYSFIRFINNFKETGNDLTAARLASEQNDAVTIMSIHKSKGLEFPVVILFAAEHQFNLMDLHKGVLYHADYGYGPRFTDTDLRITYNFAPRAALESTLYRESIAEEMRILYVALTRAKEKLIIIGSDKNIKKKINASLSGDNKKRISPALVSERMSYLDWIIMALLDHTDADVLRSYLDSDSKKHLLDDDSRFLIKIIDNTEEMKNFGVLGQNANQEISPDESAIVSLMNFSYPDIDDTKLPAKITVSELKKRRDTEILSDGYEIFKKPKSVKEKVSGLSYAEIGIAYHTVLQKYDLTAPTETKEDIKAQIDIIRSKGFLTEEEAAAVNPDKILKFFKSGTGKMLLSAKEVKREFMFGVAIPAKNFITTTKSEKQIMLQGVIDCLLIYDDSIVIIDYKTDRSFDAQDTVEKYRIQLDCYKYAAEVIFKKPVIRKILYMFEGDMGMSL